MATYVLDTGILLGYLRSSGYAQHVEKHYAPFSNPNIGVISIVTVAELKSLALQLHWGAGKVANLTTLLQSVPTIDINNPQIIDAYAEIDAYSKGRHPSRKLPAGASANKMGKNDLWIAATAFALNGTLICTDHDFDHLDKVFIPVIYVDQAAKP